MNNPYCDLTAFESGKRLPIVHYSGFFAQPDEIIVFATPARTFSDKERVSGYTGKSGGVSVRIAKGVSVRSGQSASRAVRESVRAYNYGDLIITNKRVVFTGKDDSFEFSIPKLTAIRMMDSNSFVIQSGKTSKNIYCENNGAKYAYGFIDYIVKETNIGTDVFLKIKQFQEGEVVLDSELLTIVANNSQTNIPKATKRSGGCLSIVVKGLLFIFAIPVVIALIVLLVKGPQKAVDEPKQSSVESEADGKVSEARKVYTDKELLSLENHPRIYDDYEKAVLFYEGYDSDKIRLFDKGSRYTLYELGIKKRADDPTLLFMIRDATNNKYVSWIKINLHDEEFEGELNADKCVDYVFDYLPKDFLKYYEQDSCYKYEDSTTEFVRYTSSFRLNRDGVDAANAKVVPYPYYYSFYISYYGKDNLWEIKTDLEAFGGHDKGWIEKYATPWEIDLSKY